MPTIQELSALVAQPWAPEEPSPVAPLIEAAAQVSPQLAEAIGMTAEATGRGGGSRRAPQLADLGSGSVPTPWQRLR